MTAEVVEDAVDDAIIRVREDRLLAMPRAVENAMVTEEGAKTHKEVVSV